MSNDIIVLRKELAKVVMTRQWTFRVYLLVNIYVLLVSLTVGWGLNIQVFVLTLMILLNVGFSYMLWKLRRTQKEIQKKLMDHISDQFRKSFEQGEK